jgi:1,4-dihydroxy-2-naphthoate octaprenyltransferase
MAAAIALGRGQQALWWSFPLYGVAAVLFHAGTNVLNDYFDYRHGVDGPEDGDPTHAITQKIVSPRFMLVSGHIYFLLGILIGAPIALVRGWAFLTAGIAAALGAYFYTNARFSFKYVALGDLVVFLLMGPALVVMGVWALLGTVGSPAVVHSLPMALLVTAILHGNNLRDIQSDRDAGISTFATLLGPVQSKRFFDILIFLPFLLLPGLVVFGLAPVTTFLALPTLGMAVRLSRDVRQGEEALMNLPIRTAQLHLTFTLLYVVGLIVGGLL